MVSIIPYVLLSSLDFWSPQRIRSPHWMYFQNCRLKGYFGQIFVPPHFNEATTNYVLAITTHRQTTSASFIGRWLPSVTQCLRKKKKKERPMPKEEEERTTYA